ncbi:uncharacterized protein LOC131929848 [Physella acuta]|uniref:uncharacterized protein LOC131929848 n=1 Tax=Physella acuta TaxID=109671 RepID=UPI0027DD7E29|nr:uncharacterized protein LOC131929848 [Physella acuta]
MSLRSILAVVAIVYLALARGMNRTKFDSCLEYATQTLSNTSSHSDSCHILHTAASCSVDAFLKLPKNYEQRMILHRIQGLYNDSKLCNVSLVHHIRTRWGGEYRASECITQRYSQIVASPNFNPDCMYKEILIFCALKAFKKKPTEEEREKLYAVYIQQEANKNQNVSCSIDFFAIVSEIWGDTNSGGCGVPLTQLLFMIVLGIILYIFV